jgi:hypothetical protein|tara:strand:- start:3374 stop:3544 length:171 start_codon:yes stop_codon:yes gene_type:complete
MDTNTKDKDKDYARLRKVDEVNTHNPHINVKVNTYTKESYEFFTEVSDGEIEDIIK